MNFNGLVDHILNICSTLAYEDAFVNRGPFLFFENSERPERSVVQEDLYNNLHPVFHIQRIRIQLMK